jgi:SAM-dependent methyltransferase
MSTATSASWDVWRDADVASEFRKRRMDIPGAAAQLDVLSKLVAHVSGACSVLDLGCGDGILLETILAAHPRASGVGVDGSPDMLKAAAERFAALAPRVTLVEADFDAPAWRTALPVPSFDVIVSGFAIHHSTDERKRALYHEIHDLLRPGGVFINVEHVASATPLGERLFDRTYAEHMTRHRRSLGETVTVEQVMEELLTRPDRAANKLTPVETQLAWLREIGFIDVDCYWKWLELAILAGFRLR